MAIVVQYLPANALEIMMLSLLFISLGGAFVSNAAKCKLKTVYFNVINITLSLTVGVEFLVMSFRKHLVTSLRITGCAAQKRLIRLYFFSAVMYLFMSYTFLLSEKSW